MRTIESQIVPRLLIALSDPAQQRLAPDVLSDSYHPSPEVIEEFTRLVLHHTSEVTFAYVDLARRDGASLEAVLLHLLAPTARRLGEMWESDDVSFFEVALGLARLQTIMRDISTSSPINSPNSALEGTILLVPEIGEQHTFGLQLVGEFFRRARWDVWMEEPETAEAYLRLIAEEHFGVVGLTVGTEDRLAHLATRITATRRASRNRDVRIMVGGPLFLADPGLAKRVGADATAMDGASAVLTAKKLVMACTRATATDH